MMDVLHIEETPRLYLGFQEILQRLSNVFDCYIPQVGGICIQGTHQVGGFQLLLLLLFVHLYNDNQSLLFAKS